MEADTKLRLGTTANKKLNHSIVLYYSEIFRIFVSP